MATKGKPVKRSRRSDAITVSKTPVLDIRFGAGYRYGARSGFKLEEKDGKIHFSGQCGTTTKTKIVKAAQVIIDEYGPKTKK